MIIDSHCHINRKEYDDDRSEVLKKARNIGIKRFILINTHIKEAKNLQNIAEQEEDLFYTIGNHPSDAYLSKSLHEDLDQLCNHKKLVGMGETGLDFYYDNIDRSVQQESFAIHIDIANKHDLPLVVHTRGAEDETIALLKKANKGVLHCFTGSYDMAKKALDLGFYISLSGILTFKNAADLRETAKKLPLDRILIETDAPYLTPEPFRKVKRNEPYYVYYVGQKLAEIRNIDFEVIAKHTTENCMALFSKMY
ncbi:MAG: TatD family hydrolase [Alphaproteobacteria bacterium]|nr:MAG: TatD family hydrolase [Alphaproteobacteria bacterium]